MQAILCDACGRKFTQEDINTQTPVKAQLALEAQHDTDKARINFYAVDDFCTACVPHALVYWTEKVGVVERAQEQFNAAIKNHRTQFFLPKRQQLKAVK